MMMMMMMTMQPRYLTACVALPALLDALQVFYLGKVCKPVDVHMKGDLEEVDCQEVSHYQLNCSENQTRCRETQKGFWLLRRPRVDPSCFQRDAVPSRFYQPHTWLTMTSAWSRWPAATEQQWACGPVSHQEVARAGEGTKVGKLTEGKVEIKRFQGAFNHTVQPKSSFKCQYISCEELCSFLSKLILREYRYICFSLFCQCLGCRAATIQIPNILVDRVTATFAASHMSPLMEPKRAGLFDTVNTEQWKLLSPSSFTKD